MHHDAMYIKTILAIALIVTTIATMAITSLQTAQISMLSFPLQQEVAGAKSGTGECASSLKCLGQPLSLAPMIK